MQYHKIPGKPLWWCTSIMLCLMVANILWGAVDIPAKDIANILLGEEIEGHSSWSYIIWHSRIPQMLTATFAGAALATCGLLLQTSFRNPLAGPSILGIDSGASLGVAIVVMFLGGSISMGGMSVSGYILSISAALIGSLAVMALLSVLNSFLKSTVMLLITGVIISYITGSLISLLQFWANHDGLQTYVLWGMGNFSAVSSERLPVFIGLATTGLLLAILLIKPLDALLLGDRYAQNLGINTTKTRHMLLFTTGLLSAITTAFCGPISFIGLATPHIARFIAPSGSHRSLLPQSMFLGASIALLCNLLCNLPENSTLPINVLTPLIGAPVIIYHTLAPALSARRRR
ncbi:MAG: iron ABC transporter permease [Bacteroidaceae bacterium]|nr:iron ABC transporter permease [Bacteroidaceae bacterium]